MKEKRKGYPRRRFFGLALMVFLLLGGYFALPYAQNALVAWWEDDPFTPRCDVPNLELVYSKYNGDGGVTHLYRWHQGIQPERFTELEANNFWSLRWSPDYHTLYVEGDESFLISDTNSGVRSLGANIRAWAWSPNNEYVAIIEVSNGISYLYINENDNTEYSNSNKSLVAEGEQITSVSWSPDSQKIAFSTARQIKVMQYDSGAWKEILLIAHGDSAIWSPDSTLIAVNSIDVQVYRVETAELLWDTFDIQVAVDWGERGIAAYTSSNEMVSWGGDGEASYEDIFLADVETETTQWLADSNHTDIMGWSASDEALLFSPEIVSYSVLHFMDDGEEYLFDNLMWPQFTPDGRYVSYQKENGWIYLFDMENRNSCRLFEEIQRETYRSAWRIIPQS